MRARPASEAASTGSVGGTSPRVEAIEGRFVAIRRGLKDASLDSCRSVKGIHIYLNSGLGRSKVSRLREERTIQDGGAQRVSAEEVGRRGGKWRARSRRDGGGR